MKKAIGNLLRPWKKGQNARISLGAPRRKLYESLLVTRITNAEEDSKDLPYLQLLNSSITLQRKYTITIVITHIKINNFLLMSVILSVQMAMGYTVNPQVSVLHSSDGQKK